MLHQWLIPCMHHASPTCDAPPFPSCCPVSFHFTLYSRPATSGLMEKLNLRMSSCLSHLLAVHNEQQQCMVGSVQIIAQYTPDCLIHQTFIVSFMTPALDLCCSAFIVLAKGTPKHRTLKRRVMRKARRWGKQPAEPLQYTAILGMWTLIVI